MAKFMLFPYTTLFRSCSPQPWGQARRRRPLGHSGACRKRRAQAFRSEEHTSELQLLRHLVCRLLLEKKKKKNNKNKNILIKIDTKAKNTNRAERRKYK